MLCSHFRRQRGLVEVDLALAGCWVCQRQLHDRVEGRVLKLLRSPISPSSPFIILDLVVVGLLNHR